LIYDYAVYVKLSSSLHIVDYIEELGQTVILLQLPVTVYSYS